MTSISQMNWQQVEEYLQRDDRCVLPIGCTEQHAYLSLSTDSLLAEKISLDAALPMGIPVFPVMPYGITPAFMAFPGTVTLQPETFFSVLRDVLDSLVHHGFRRILILNGHGGNAPAAEIVKEWESKNKNAKVKFCNWWIAPKTWEKVKAIDPVASHASWMENFPWTRLENVIQPKMQKQMVNLEQLRKLSPEEVRKVLVDGNYGGYFEKPDKEMMELWNVAVEEIREMIVDL
jgi:creatinine amidohydrolase